MPVFLLLKAANLFCWQIIYWTTVVLPESRKEMRPQSPFFSQPTEVKSLSATCRQH